MVVVVVIMVVKVDAIGFGIVCMYGRHERILQFYTSWCVWCVHDDDEDDDEDSDGDDDDCDCDDYYDESSCGRSPFRVGHDSGQISNGGG